MTGWRHDVAAACDLTVAGADGMAWSEPYSNATPHTIDGIESFSVDVALAPGAAASTSFTIAYDALIEAVSVTERWSCSPAPRTPRRPSATTSQLRPADDLDAELLGQLSADVVRVVRR